MAEHYTLIDSKVIFDQFQRLKFMKYFPKKLDESGSYFDEFRRVMMRCKNDIMAVKVIDEWIDEHTDRPTVSELSQIITKHVLALDDGSKFKNPREKRCQKCYGDGHISIPMLVTYHSDSGYEAKEHQPMPDTDWPSAMRLRAKLGRNQDIVGGTIRCVCNQGEIEAQDTCSKCNGFGYHSGRLMGKRAAPWTWCDCRHAEFAKTNNPETVNEANAAREKLLNNFSTLPQKLQEKVESRL